MSRIAGLLPAGPGSDWRSLGRGLVLAGMVGAAANFLAQSYGAPVMLFALLIGMSLHAVADQPTCAQGVGFASQTLLRWGVALMGLRLSVQDVSVLGWFPVLAVAVLVLATLGAGVFLSYVFGRKKAFGLLAGGSVAICGASAALAIASVLPRREGREADTLLVITGVTVLSTLAMIAYPILFRALDFNPAETAFLIGATIHDVAQVAGAGHSISDEVGVLATFVKMLRVALLPAVLLLVALSFRGTGEGRKGLPWFLVVFVALAVLGNANVLPGWLVAQLVTLSQACLIVAIAALGLRTNLGRILDVDRRYVAMLVLLTLFLLGLAVCFVLLVPLDGQGAPMPVS
ncbi:putative sulfate exporter family transporter [Roseibacterium sp. SDUM158017]|uniref:YeiH family protein n=1 Tax=Roseicyclus salinarum TaxID=3036773 RepID=UPI0024158480|nr:putative sulfate exporter family transporter [Roseibacterium sp. SDUM158017]MDG4647507.1 putative sulfate exporter family transporter [Roseibacterium sp. SDUM158017]